jgi:2-keto-3-deoxy-L-rhamnonate aldolase RhmA
MNETFLERLRSGRRLLGTMITLPSPEIAEGLARCGFDWLWIDLEHSALSMRDAGALLVACAGRAHGLVRVPSNDPVRICQVLDLGAEGVIVPQIRTAAEAAAAVAAARYPPEGRRGAGVGRAQGFGLRFGEYVRRANSEIAVVLQIEHIDAVEKAESILAVPGVDAALIGPYDLSGSLGLLGQVGHAEVATAMERVRKACEARDVPLGIFTLSPEEARRRFEEGYRFVAVGIDSNFLLTAARQAREAASPPA